MIVQTEKIMIMEKYFIHSNELHLIDMDKIHQAVERIVDSLDMAAGSTCHFDLYKVVETYFKDLDKRSGNKLLIGYCGYGGGIGGKDGRLLKSIF